MVLKFTKGNPQASREITRECEIVRERRKISVSIVDGRNPQNLPLRNVFASTPRQILVPSTTDR